MWSLYAKECQGYCIEYDIEKYYNNNQAKETILKEVIYSNERKNDPVEILLKTIYSNLISTLGFTCEKFDYIDAVYKIASTKSTDWAYQKEWRFIGDAGDKSICLPIKAVYLGKNMKSKNRKIIENIAGKHNYKLFYQVDDFEKNVITFSD